MSTNGTKSSGPLAGVKIIELAGIGPAPLCCSLLSDMGADILRIDRNAPSGLGSPRKTRTDLLRRGRASVAIDMKHPDGVATVLKLVEQADVIIDPFRPGVAERLGLGPDECLARNPKLIYGRMTGWGQDGTLNQAAGHDLNYLALTGVLHAIGPKDLPTPPLNVVADMGGGAMFLAVGILAGVIEARQSGKGQVVDTAMTEGSAYLGTGAFGSLAAGDWVHERNSNILDGGAHFYRCYKTSDGKFVSIASIEAKFYAILLDKLGLDPADLPAQMDRPTWPEMSLKLEGLFAKKTRDEWCEIMEGTDICFAPVLTFDEAFDHPHAKTRGSFVEVDGVKQPVPAPRFSRTPSAIKSPPPEYGADTAAGLASWGMSKDEINKLLEDKAVGWQG
ncbi:MAG: CoA transferase [Rhodospirillaceae bacterium]|jgi:alpha-methylacyl-CoA racemase|nr:CoA transferase [Rhodospirillaceae bacterium]MBT5898264.1 CoA transferase [Rhodospirillaceae bacterium]MBT6430745.1 CoA transferase [Rhodospirillaceae bacterium]